VGEAFLLPRPADFDRQSDAKASLLFVQRQRPVSVR